MYAKMKFLTSLVFLLISISAFSQIEYYKESFLQADRFYLNGEKVKFKDVKNIESILKQSPNARDEFLKGKKDARLSLISSILGVGSWLYGGLSVFRDEQTDALGYNLGLFGGAILAYYFDRQKAKHYRNASNIYNKETGSTQILVKPTVSENGVGLAVKF